MGVIEAIPKRYGERLLSGLTRTSDNGAALDACEGWLDEYSLTDKVPGIGMAFVGPPGTGKTAIACALAVTAEAAGLSVDFVTMPDLRQMLFRQMDLMDIIRRMKEIDDFTPELVEHRVRSRRLHEMRNEVDLLVIDDLGREITGDSRFIEDQIDSLIRHRGDRGLAMVVTSNLDRKERAKRYGEPLESYLHDVCEFISVDGDDWRRS